MTDRSAVSHPASTDFSSILPSHADAALLSSRLFEGYLLKNLALGPHIFGLVYAYYLGKGCMVSSARGLQLSDYREYLCLLARLELDERFVGKVDLSGVVQQTLLEAHQSLERFRGQTETEVASWLRRILANNLTDEVRKLTAQARDIVRERSLHDSAARIEAWLAVEQPSPSKHLLHEEQLMQLAVALASLPADQRTAVELHHLKGLKLAEIAVRMKKTRASVASLIFRGMDSLRCRLDENEESTE
jgi:RNA polymerase sigma-70 factor (ECF subfamily)